MKFHKEIRELKEYPVKTLFIYDGLEGYIIEKPKT